MNLLDLCSNPYVLRLFLILQAVIKIVSIVVPLIIIGTIIMKLFTVVTNGKEDDLKLVLSFSVKKIIAGLIIFFLPTIINFTISLIGDSSYEINFCESNLNLETVQYYERLIPIEEKIQRLENNPTKKNLEAAEAAVTSISNFATEATMQDYLQRISDAKNDVDAYQKLNECRAKGGTLKNGYCRIPPKPTPSKPDIESGEGSGVMVDSSLLNGNYKVIEPAISVASYLNVISSNRISQTNDRSVYGDKCLAFSYIHAYSLYSGNTSARAKDSLSYKYASNFNGYVNDDKKEVLKNIYSELTNGKPVIIQVNGNKAGTSRHYVTVVGFKKDVKRASDLEEEDLLIIDSWDGKLESMDSATSRFMVTGKACHKKYTGYQMYYVE